MSELIEKDGRFAIKANSVVCKTEKKRKSPTLEHLEKRCNEDVFSIEIYSNELT